MLKSIQIRHYVLIESLDISFHQGFAVITGETGAGKSIILGALNLMMGARAESRVISEGADKCTVEGHFDITGYDLKPLFDRYGLDYDEHDTIIRREVSKSGKSRAFINDTPVGLGELKEIGSHLIDIHSQHQNLLLGTERFQKSVTDTIAANAELRKEFKTAYISYRDCTSQLEKLRREIRENLKEQDYLRFQYDELSGARLSDGEQEELESEQDVLSHAGEIKDALFKASEILDGEQESIISGTRAALQSLRNAARNLPAASALADRLDSCLIELKDISSEISEAAEDTSFNPQRLDEIAERLDLIYSLQKKHGCDSVASLVSIMRSIAGKLDGIDSCDQEIERLESEQKRLCATVKKLAAELTETRKHAAAEAGQHICQALIPLGIPGAKFKIEVREREAIDENGADTVCFLFSANQGARLQELSDIASGGELSRVMLVIKSMLAGASGLPTIIFDEIDTGVSGGIAEKMALMMRDMCNDGRQVIAISHLPQIAAKSSSHYLVFKKDGEDATHTYITELTNEQRITEIAKMMSGAVVTDAALDNARALMNN